MLGIWDLRVPWTARRVNPKISQPWIFIGRIDAEVEAPILWPPDAKSRLIGKDPDAGKDWGQEKGVTEDEMVGWHHWLNGHEFEQTLGDGEGQGSMACCSPWGRKESNTTEWLNNINRHLINEIRGHISCSRMWPGYRVTSAQTHLQEISKVGTWSPWGSFEPINIDFIKPQSLYPQYCTQSHEATEKSQWDPGTVPFILLPLLN